VGERDDSPTSPGLFRAWQAGSEDVIAAMAAYRSGRMTLSGGGREAVRLTAYNTTPELFDVMHVRPLLGRSLREEDAAPDVRSVVVSHDVWRSMLGADPELAGRTMELDGEPWTVVGVMPPGVAFPSSHGTDLWTPLVLSESLWSNTSSLFLSVAARLRPGVAIERAEATLASITAEVLASSERRYTARLVGYRDSLLTSDVLPSLLVLQAVAVLVLVIAAVNIANLLLASTTSRRVELSVRAALGADRWRLARQLLTEGLLLATAGGAAALLAAWWLGPALLAAYPAPVPVFQPVTLGPAEIAAAAGLIVATTLAISAAPVVLGARADLRPGLADAAAGSGSGGRRWLRSVLVGSQVALAVVLLVGGVLLIRSYWTLTVQPLGFDPGSTLVGRLSLPEARYADAAARRSFVEALTERLDAQPEVAVAAAATRMPFDLSITAHSVDVESPGGEPTRLLAQTQVVTPGYFDAVGMTMRRGRVIAAVDRDATAPVAVVNEAFARKVHPSGDVVGRRFKSTLPDAPWTTIVGVAADARIHYRWEVKPEVYYPVGTGDMTAFSVIVRADGEPAPPVGQVVEIVRALDSAMPLEFPRSYGAMIAASVSAERFNMAVLTLMAVLATVLASVGIAGVMLYVVRLRTRELGIRLALGARVGQMQRLMVWQALRPLVAGLAAGCLAASWLAPVLESQLFGVQSHDTLAFVAAPALFLAVGLVACWWPAARAARVDPASILRAE
jgi:predicted permease